MYHSAMACMTRVRMVVDWPWMCQANGRMMPEFGWLFRKMGIKLVRSSCFKVGQCS